MSTVKLYADEHIKKHITNWLRKSGVDILSTEDAKNKGRTDVEQLDFASLQKRTVLTEDIGFLAIQGLFGHSGIFLITGRKTAKEIVSKVVSLLEMIDAEDVKGVVVYI